MKQTRFLLLSCLLVIIALLLFSSLRQWVIAQNSGQTLEVSPPSQEVNADPGQTITVTAKIRNRSSGSLPIAVRVEDFTASGEEGQVALSSASPWSVASWTKVSPQSFMLYAGEEQEITATISVPKDAAGGRYGSFVFGVESKADPNAASLSQQIASLFLVRISGPVNEVLELTDFTAPAFSEFGPIPFSMKFINKGNVHVKTYGIVGVTNMFGQKAADIVVPGTNVFPQASRIVTAQLNKRFLFGPHTATAVMYYGNTENQTLTATETFFVFPVKIAGIILGIIFILFLMRKRLGKALRILFKG